MPPLKPLLIEALAKIGALIFCAVSAVNVLLGLDRGSAPLQCYFALGGGLFGLAVFMAADAYGRYCRADEERRRASAVTAKVAPPRVR